MPHLIDKHRLLLSTMDEDADALAREYDLGLELADFTYAPMMEDPDRVKTAERKMEGIHTFLFHGPFAELCPCAIDPRVRQVSMDRVIQAAELAEKAMGPEHGPLTAFEKACDDTLTAYLEGAKSVPFGVEVVVGYLYAKESELTAVRTVLSGRLAGLDGELIRSRLRNTYL